MPIESVMPSSHLILCRPLFLLPSVFPSIRVFPSESARWRLWWAWKSPKPLRQLLVRAVLPRFVLSPDTTSPGRGPAPSLTLSADPSLSDATVPQIHWNQVPDASGLSQKRWGPVRTPQNPHSPASACSLPGAAQRSRAGPTPPRRHSVSSEPEFKVSKSWGQDPGPGAWSFSAQMELELQASVRSSLSFFFSSDVGHF